MMSVDYSPISFDRPWIHIMNGVSFGSLHGGGGFTDSVCQNHAEKWVLQTHNKNLLLKKK